MRPGAGPALPPPEKLTREPVRRRPLGSGVTTSSGWPSSDLKLRCVPIEFSEMRRLRFLERVRSRSSEKWPCAVNCGCSAGWERAEAKASRTGKGVKFRT